MLVTCPSTVLATTLQHLREAGTRRCECIVLWLGRPADGVIRVEEAYVPLHEAREDMFHIPPASMTTLHAYLRKHRLMVAAQVHSHPREAFHSLADDRWAIIRHEGALSLVLPYFAASTTPLNFGDEVKVYRFSDSAEWVEVARTEVEALCLQLS
jgi:proteasome lid subunit RPN8/RPN11